MTEADLIRTALERGGAVGPSAAETMALQNNTTDGVRNDIFHNTPPWEKETEKQFMGRVIALAKLNGWKVYHTHDSRRSEPGFPDLVLVRERVIFAELKADKGKPTKAQREWLLALESGGATFLVWRPRDWDDIVKVLA